MVSMAAQMTLEKELNSKQDSLFINVLNRYGANTKRLPRIRTLWELILENFEDRIL